MRLPRIDQHIKDEPCAKQRGYLGTWYFLQQLLQPFLEVSDPGVNFFFMPLVLNLEDL
jgi:hypothetical protein